MAFSIGSTACVSLRHYEDCVADANKVRVDLATTQKNDAVQVADLQQQLSQAQAAMQDRDAKLSDLSTADHNHQAQLDEATAINQQLRDELQRMGKDADKMLAERGTISRALDDAKARLEELRKAQAAAEARTQLFRDFAIRFKPLIDAGQLVIQSRRGELVMDVQGDLLFDEGKSDLRTAGKGALMEIARALQTTSPPSSGRRFLVTADIDGPDPKPAKRPRSPWELTAARAVAVVEYLVSVGVPPTSLTAAAAGSFDPLMPRDDPGARSKNRRIEVALLPSADAAPRVGAAP
jgi:chemotaxis protein MotB